MTPGGMTPGGMIRRVTAFIVLAALAGCSGFTPFVTAPPAPEKGEVVNGARLAICYNGMKTPPEKLQEMAQSQCLGNTRARLSGTDYRMDNCPAMTPGRATFVCEPVK